MISEGQPAPDVELESDTGDRVKLADFRGKTVVLYFYPKDDPPGWPDKSSISWCRRSPIRGNGPHPFGGITSRDGGGKLAIAVHHGVMQISLRDPAYTDRLAAFLRSLGQTVVVNGPNRVELVADDVEL